MKKRKNGKRLLAWILCLCLVGTLCPVTVRAGELESTGKFNVSGGEYGTDYDYANGVLTIKTGTKMTISTSSETNERILIESNVNADLIFNGVSLYYANNSSEAVLLKENSNTNLELQGVNSLKSEYGSGIKMATNTSLTFGENSSGSLTVIGGNGGGRPGIDMDSTAVLTINDGRITAIGGHNNFSKTEYVIGEGIKGGTVNVNGGYVTAQGALHYNDWTPITTSGISGTFTAGGDAIVDTIHGIEDKSCQENWKGIIFDDKDGQVYGNYTLDSDFTIPNGKKLTIPVDTTLRITEEKKLEVAPESNLVINGMVDDSVGTLSVDVTGKISGEGSISKKIIPPAPIAAEQTANSITLQVPSGSGGNVEYKGPGNWQSEPIFTGLQPSQEYSFGVRFTNDRFYDGISAEVRYYTAFATPETGVGFSIDYEQETITVQDDYIVTTANGSDGYWGNEVRSGDSCYVQSYDRTFYIRKKGKDNIPASAPQSILIPARPSCDLSVDCVKEGIVIPSGYCYSTDHGKVKENKVAEDTFVPLNPSEYVYVCKSAITEGENKAFASNIDQVTAPQRPATPSVFVNYVTEALSTTAAMEYKIDNGQWTNCTANMSAADFGWDNTKSINVTFRVKATEDKYASETQSLTINAGEEAPTTGEGYVIDYINETLTVNSGFEVNTKSDFTGNTITSGEMKPMISSSNMNYYIRKAASSSVPASSVTNFVVPSRPNAPAAGCFTVNQPTVAGVTGNVAGITDEMEYSLDAGNIWKNGTGTVISVDDQTTVWIRYKAVANSKFASNHYSVTISHEPKFYATVTGGSGSGEYAQGETVTITANAAPSGQQFKEWTIESGNITLASSTSATTTFVMPAEAVSVKVNYEAIPVTEYTITASSEENGSISPSGMVKVAAGGSQTFTISPNSGYEVDTLKVDGLEVTATTSYTFSNVNANHTIEVTFKQGSQTSGGGSSSSGGGSYTPSIPQKPTEPTQPQIKNDKGNTGWTAIEKKIEETIKTQTEGGTKKSINIDMNGTTTVPKSVLDTVKGKDVTIIFDMGNGISWTVNGKDVTGASSDINFGVKTNTNAIPVDIINKVTGERMSVQMSLEHNGEFGLTATLKLNLEPKNKGMYANLFYYNSKAESGSELEFICADKIDEEGNANLIFTHASDYTIILDKEPMQVEKPEESTEQEKPSDPTTTEVTAPKKGTLLTDSKTKMVYKITKSGINGGTVQFVKTKNIKAKTIAIHDKVTIDGITYKVTSIAAGALKNNKTVTTVTIGKYVTSIGSSAFSNCTKLKKVTIGMSVTTIGSKVFYKCASLTNITIPSKVKKIGNYTFKGCRKLKNITIKTTLLTSETVSKNAFSGFSNSAVVKVQKSKAKAYKELLVKKGLGKKAIFRHI